MGVAKLTLNNSKSEDDKAVIRMKHKFVQDNQSSSHQM